jgi:hypothetical protein
VCLRGFRALAQRTSTYISRMLYLLLSSQLNKEILPSFFVMTKTTILTHTPSKIRNTPWRSTLVEQPLPEKIATCGSWYQISLGVEKKYVAILSLTLGICCGRRIIYHSVYSVGNNLFFFLAGFDCTTLSSSFLGGRRRRQGTVFSNHICI